MLLFVVVVVVIYVCLFSLLRNLAGNCDIDLGYFTLFSPAGVLSSLLLFHSKREKGGRNEDTERDREPQGTKRGVIKCSSIEATTTPEDREAKFNGSLPEACFVCNLYTLIL